MVIDEDFFPAVGLNWRDATGKVLDADFFPAAGAVLLLDKPEASLGFLEGGGGADLVLCLCYLAPSKRPGHVRALSDFHLAHFALNGAKWKKGAKRKTALIAVYALKGKMR